jgi:hypothetical protein
MKPDIEGLEFIYNGTKRIVDNVTEEKDAFNNPKNIIGYEVSKDGRFSYKIKRYDVRKMKNVRHINNIYRSGPKVKRP